ncbi:hypothetical protein TcWFU_004957 [Taenia crassiceps]|uniref:ArsA/GET3 Anion-transporting ATPase-like domain-containing protein n=1 Tax=Taenia crassiceps TaxID=6207 RepID=A0ABR4QH42_9CEST
MSEPSIQNLLDQVSLRWIFVGGKGGVGKTTCSCSLAVELSKVRERVLIISTDPAHNLSDAFDQKFSRSPTLVNGFNNLYAMEIDPNMGVKELEEDVYGAEEATHSADLRRTLASVLTSVPGIDEYMSYTEVFRLVRSMDYSVVVFDTAPTGHTLRLLAFPELVENGMSNQMMSFLGVGGAGGGMLASEDFTQAIEARLPIALAEQEIDIHNIIVNQLLFPNIATGGDQIDLRSVEVPTECSMCKARHRIQTKYLEQILELYDDMHVIQLPQLDEEVRGKDKVCTFSQYLLHPYTRPSPSGSR